MYKQESILDNETHTILWDFEIQMGCLMSGKRSNQVLIKKKKNLSSWFALTEDNSKNKRKRKDEQVIGLC